MAIRDYKYGYQCNRSTTYDELVATGPDEHEHNEDVKRGRSSQETLTGTQGLLKMSPALWPRRGVNGAGNDDDVKKKAPNVSTPNSTRNRAHGVMKWAEGKSEQRPWSAEVDGMRLGCEPNREQLPVETPGNI